jgi:ankyrin repeat protein
MRESTGQGPVNRLAHAQRSLGVLLLFPLLSSGAVHAANQCIISDWPLGLPEGTADMVRFITPATAMSVAGGVVHHAVPALAARRAASPESVATGAPIQPRDWKAGRSVAPDTRQRLMYAVADDDVAQVKRSLQSSVIDVNEPLEPGSRRGLLDIAVQGAQPEVVRLLIASGAHVRAGVGERVDVHPIASAVNSLDTYVHWGDRPDPFVGRPRRSIERYVAVIHALLDAGADPDTPIAPSESLSPLGTLMFAPRFEGDVELARALIAHGARAEGTVPLRSPLAIAVERGYEDYADLFLSGRVNTAALSEALIQAMRHQNFGMAEKLVAAGADPNTVDSGTPVLCRAMQSMERRPLALALLAHHANVNADCGAPGAGDRTPLTLADQADREMVDLLVTHGARLEVPANDRAEFDARHVQAGPIIWSVMHHRDYLASRLIARDSAAGKDECGAVVYAASYGAHLTLAELFKLGADPNETSAHGTSALMAAAYHGETAAMEVLLAQPHIHINQSTPSHFNAKYFDEFFSIQIEGTKPPFRWGSRTALMLAALGGSGDATALLVAHGARVHQTDAEALEALQYARGAAASQVLANAGRP